MRAGIMRILYVAMKYDYGRPSQGLSFEHCNFYHALLHMGHDMIYFDFMTLMQKHGQAWMNHRLLEVARKEKPDVMFSVLFSDEIAPASMRTLTDDVGIPTVNWFCDDHWRFESYSRLWAPCFRWVVTTAHSAIPKYAEMGYRNVIKSQWACNTFLYAPNDAPPVHDVTFVGQPYGNRRDIIDQLRKAGITVRVWGTGWDSGRVSQEEMIQIFNQSRINLNLTTAYGSTGVPATQPTTTPPGLIRRLLARIKPVQATNASTSGAGSMNGASLTADNHPDQIKGRNFEVPGCGGFLLTGYADHLEDYYKSGQEIVCFRSVNEMIDQIRYYLAHEDERRSIAKAGYERTRRDHTYERRLHEIFARIGLVRGSDMRGALLAGHTEEVR